MRVRETRGRQKLVWARLGAIPNGKNLFCEPRKRPMGFHREARKALTGMHVMIGPKSGAGFVRTFTR